MGLSGEPRVLARPAGTSSVGSCPCGQQGPQWRVTSCTWTPGDTAALSSEPQACLSVPAALSWGQCPDLTSNQGQRDGHTTKMNFLQEPRPPGVPGQGMRDPCRGCPIAHRTPGCSQCKRDAGKDPLSPSVSFKNIPWCVIWQFQHFELNYGN